MPQESSSQLEREMLLRMLAGEDPAGPSMAPALTMPVRVPATSGPEVPLRDQGMFERFLSGAAAGAGAPNETEGGGMAGLAGYTAGTAATGGLGLAAKLAAVVPPKAAKLMAEKLVKGIKHKPLQEVFEWLKNEKKLGRTLGQATEISEGVVPGGFAAANSELEFRIADLAEKRLAGNPNPSADDITQARNYVREQLEKNLSPERLDNLGKVFRIRVDPSAHGNFFELGNSAAHELRHGTDMMRKGRNFQPEYAEHDALIEALEAAGEKRGVWTNPMEDVAENAGAKVEEQMRKWYRSKYGPTRNNP